MLRIENLLVSAFWFPSQNFLLLLSLCASQGSPCPLRLFPKFVLAISYIGMLSNKEKPKQDPPSFYILHG